MITAKTAAAMTARDLEESFLDCCARNNRGPKAPHKAEIAILRDQLSKRFPKSNQ